MLRIDKSATQARIVVTVTEKTTTVNPTYFLHLYSPYSHTSFYTPLPDNTSPHRERYDEFVLDPSVFDGVDEGQYSYTIKETTDGVVEQGVLMVVDKGFRTVEEYTAPTPDETDDDFITYNPD